MGKKALHEQVVVVTGASSGLSTPAALAAFAQRDGRRAGRLRRPVGLR